MNHRLEEAAGWVRGADHLLIFTGAGVSAESNIPTFRDDDGFWQKFKPEYFATWPGLIATLFFSPRRFIEFLRAVIDPIAEAKPNLAHIAIAKAAQNKSLTVVTQNIDGLHQEAGSTGVCEIHGSMLEINGLKKQLRSTIDRQVLKEISANLEKAGRSFFILPGIIKALKNIVGFGRCGIYYPNVVLFGAALAEPAWTNALTAAKTSDCVIQIGCSGLVVPAATLPEKAEAAGARIIAIDPRPADGDIWLRGTAAEIVPQLFAAAFGPLILEPANSSYKP